MDIHIYFHDNDNGVKERLDRIEHLLTRNQRDILMAITAAEKAIVDRFNAATTKLSDRLDKLIAANPDLDPEFAAQLTAIADHLDVMGTDPDNPTPALP